MCPGSDERGGQVKLDWMKPQLAHDRQRIVRCVLSIRRNTKRASKRPLGNPIVIASRDQLGNLVLQLALSLENVELRNRARFEPALLILQLALKQVYRLFLNLDQSPIKQYLIELGSNGLNDLIDRVAKGVVSGVFIDSGSTAGSDRRAAIPDQLGSGESYLPAFQGRTRTG